VLVVAVSCGDQRTGVADDHLSAEAVGEEVVVVGAKVAAAAGEGAEEGWRPFGSGFQVGAASGFGEHGGDLLLGELVDESVQLIPVGAHEQRLPGGTDKLGSATG